MQAYKLLPLPLQGLYRGLHAYYSALQAFSALAGCILWLFVALMGQRGGVEQGRGDSDPGGGGVHGAAAMCVISL